MGLRGWLFASVYDRLTQGAEEAGIRSHRERLLARARVLEHVRSDDPKLAAWQDRLNGLNRFVSYGCNCNRATVDAIREAGFTITSLAPDSFPKAPPFVRPLVVGSAASPARP